MKTYNKSRKLSTQTSFLITLTIALITSISARGYFYRKRIKELTLNFQTLMYQESNMTISSISDDISTIDSIYRLWYPTIPFMILWNPLLRNHPTIPW